MMFLYYMKNTESRYSTFVNSRLDAIHRLTPVGSDENPAEITSTSVGYITVDYLK